MKHNPLVVCLLIICITILTFTLLTRQTLYELRFRDGDKEVAALVQVRASAGIFPAHLTSGFIFSWHPFYTSVSACFFRCTNRTIITDKFAACRTV